MSRKKTTDSSEPIAAGDEPLTSAGEVTVHPPQEMPAVSDTAAAPAAPEVPVVPERQLPKVPLRTFAAQARIKDDQLEPFLADAMRRKLEPRTIPEWRQAWTDFQRRPV